MGSAATQKERRNEEGIVHHRPFNNYGRGKKTSRGTCIRKSPCINREAGRLKVNRAVPKDPRGKTLLKEQEDLAEEKQTTRVR